jgi:hypothetical protein
MTEKRIRFRVRPGGRVEVEAVGYRGPECLEATRPYEEALGSKDPERVEKPAMHELTAVDERLWEAE